MTQWWTVNICLFNHFYFPFFLCSLSDLQNWGSVEVICPGSASCCLCDWVASSSAECCIRVVGQPWNGRTFIFSESILDPVLLSHYQIVWNVVNFPEQEILATWLVNVQTLVSDNRVCVSSWRQAEVACNCFGSTIVRPVKKWQVCIGLTRGAPWATNAFYVTWEHWLICAGASFRVEVLQFSACKSTLAGAVSFIECEACTVSSNTISVCSRLACSGSNPKIALTAAVKPVWRALSGAILGMDWANAATVSIIEDVIRFVFFSTILICNIPVWSSSNNEAIALAVAVDPVRSCRNGLAICWFNWTETVADRLIENVVLYVIWGTLGVCNTLVFSSINPVIALAVAVDKVWSWRSGLAIPVRRKQFFALVFAFSLIPVWGGQWSEV